MSSDRQRPIDRIAPDDFVSRVDSRASFEIESFDDAFRYMELAPSSTPDSQKKRCPQCATTRIKRKQSKMDMSFLQRPEEYKCDRQGCISHFDNPLPPRSEFDAIEPICPGCGSFRLRIVPIKNTVKCLDCDGRFDSAARGEFESNPILSDADREKIRLPTNPATDELRRLRRKLNLTRSRLEGFGSSTTTLSSWEQGRCQPTDWRLRALTAYYDVVDCFRRAERLADVINWGTNR